MVASVVVDAILDYIWKGFFYNASWNGSKYTHLFQEIIFININKRI